jgi:hypothetical protein
MMTRAALIMTVAAGLVLGATAPADVSAQGASAAARGKAQGQQARQQAQGQQARQQSASAQQRREAERETLRRQQARQAELDRQRELDRRRELDRQRELDRRRELDRQRDWDRQRDVYGRQQQRGGSPAFCRSGSGHPVFGRQWCRDKGFALGSERWDSRRMGDIILRQPRDRDQQRMGRSVLTDVLGDVVFGRFEALGRQHGRGEVNGSWLDLGHGRMLQLSVGSVPFAELIDSNRDGRVDRVLVRR